VIVTLREIGELAVKRGNLVGIVGDRGIEGNLRTVIRLEEIAEVFRPPESVHPDGLATGGHIRDPVSEQGTDKLMAG